MSEVAKLFAQMAEALSGSDAETAAKLKTLVDQAQPAIEADVTASVEAFLSNELSSYGMKIDLLDGRISALENLPAPTPPDTVAPVDLSDLEARVSALESDDSANEKAAADLATHFNHDGVPVSDTPAPSSSTTAIIPPMSGAAEAGGSATTLGGQTTVENVPGNTVDASTGTAPAPGGDTAPASAPTSDPTYTQPIGEVAAPESTADTAAAAEVGEQIVPGAATGPDAAGVVRNDQGYVAAAPAGSMDAAFAGEQVSNTTGQTTSTGTDNPGDPAHPAVPDVGAG